MLEFIIDCFLETEFIGWLISVVLFYPGAIIQSLFSTHPVGKYHDLEKKLSFSTCCLSLLFWIIMGFITFVTIKYAI